MNSDPLITVVVDNKIKPMMIDDEKVVDLESQVVDEKASQKSSPVFTERRVSLEKGKKKNPTSFGSFFMTSFTLSTKTKEEN